MNEKNFKGVDLNLLVVFAIVMRERSTTRASQCLFLSQSAVSHSIRRLRALFDDALFVRTRNGVVPTPRAEVLYDELQPILDAIETKLIERTTFEPAISERAFKLALPSSINVCVMPILLDQLRYKAPRINLVVRSADLHTGPSLLDGEEIDLAVSYFPHIENWHRGRALGKHNYSCLFDGRRLGIKPPISLDSFLALPHVFIAFANDRLGIVDEVLAARGLSRRVLAMSADSSSIPFYLFTTDAIATLPDYAARMFAKHLKLTYSPIPVQLPDFPLSMIWHTRCDGDAGHAWFRELVRECVEIGALDRIPPKLS